MMKYYTKVDFFYWLVIAAIAFLSLLVSNFIFIMGMWYLSAVIMGAIIYILFVLVFSYVQIIDDCIVIQVGLFKKIISFEDIIEIKKVSNIRTSPAMSINRLGIKLKNKKDLFSYVFISPKKEDEFLSEIKSKAKNIQIAGF